jgi:hypothetical protein
MELLRARVHASIAHAISRSAASVRAAARAAIAAFSAVRRAMACSVRPAARDAVIMLAMRLSPSRLARDAASNRRAAIAAAMRAVFARTA